MLPRWVKFDLLFHFTKFRGRVSHFGLLTFWALFNNCIEMYNVSKCMKYKGKLIRLSEFLSLIWVFKMKGNDLGNSRRSPSSDRNILIQAARLCTDIWKYKIQGSFFKICNSLCDTSKLLFTLCGYRIGNRDRIVLANVGASLLFRRSIPRKTCWINSRSRSIKSLGPCTGLYHSITYNNN